jgi:PAS domain S-box-containing protein
LLEVIEEAGVDTAPLVARLPVPFEVLRNAARIDWDPFITLVEGLEEICRGKLSLEDIGTRINRAPSFHFLRLVGQLLVSPRQLYIVAHRMVAPAMFSNVTVTQEWLSSERLLIVGELAPGYRESEAFFQLCHASVTATPRLLDLPPSSIEEQTITGRSGRLTLCLPKSHTLAARIRRQARAVFALGDAFRVVTHQQEELEGSLAALRTSRHELRQLIERLPDGVLLYRDGIVSWANAAMVALLGYERVDEVIGRSVLDFAPEDDRPALAAVVARAAQNIVRDERVEYRLLRADGSIRRVQASSVPNVELEGTPARLVVVRDMTEHDRLREQLSLGDRMASLGRLAAGVAHEINNPLAYVHTSLEVASRDLEALGDPRTANIAQSIARAQDGAARVRSIVHDLKMLSRAEDEPTEAVDLPGVLDSTIALATSAIGPKAKVTRRYGDAPRARATRGRLGQLFLNLLLNAADAIAEEDADGTEILVTTGTDTEGHAVIEIADRGAGIPPAVAERIFDPFFTTKQVGAGTGLGLAICHRIVTQLGGNITFASTPGKGTTFRVVLPAAEEQPALPLGEAPVPHRARILVVDDEPVLLRSIEDLLGESHDVVTRASGREALDLLHADRGFDVIVADLMMPGVTGMDLFESASAKYPGLERRFVFMTGGAFTNRSRELISRIPNRCVDKPFDGDELLRAIGEVMDQH